MRRRRRAKLKRHVTLPAHGSVPIDFPTEIVATGKAQWRWSVHFVSADKKTELSDALQSEVNVGYPAPLVREVETKRIESNEAELKRISDPQILEGSGQATVDVANTRVIELRESLRYLLHYPYGCVEQTTSSLLPWLMVRDLRATLPELAKTDAEIAAAVNRGVNLLMSMQTSDGGLSFWPGGREPTFWGSAYGGLALAVAQKQKFSVPDAETKKLFGYLSGQLRGMAKDATGYGLSAQCLAVYTLAVAGKPEPAYHDLLFQKRAKLSAEDRALVALAVIESKGPKAMIDELLRAPAANEGYLDQFFGSVARENALHLLAWTLHEPRSPRVDELAVELFKRRSNGHWSTTQANAWSLLALSSYLRQVETGDKNATGQISWDKATAPFAVSKDKPLASPVTFPIINKTAAEPIRVTKSGGQIFSEVTVEARPKLIERPRQDRGYADHAPLLEARGRRQAVGRGKFAGGRSRAGHARYRCAPARDLSRGGGSVAGCVRSDQSRVQVAGSCRGRNTRDRMGERLSGIAGRSRRVFCGSALSRALHVALSCARHLRRRRHRRVGEDRGDVPSGTVRNDGDGACAARSR